MTDDHRNEEQDAPGKCPRPYRLGLREKAMEETRARVIAAARELILGEDALAGFSLDAVARKAGVTRMTVYHRFGSKRGLLEALFDTMGARGSLGERLSEVFSQPDPLAAFRGYIDIFCDFWEIDRVMNRRLRGFAALDEEFAAAIAYRYERRHHAIEFLLSRLAKEERAASATISEEQVQTVLALTGFEFYDVLAGDRAPQSVAAMIYDLMLSVLRSDEMR
jgi:AcrR family transcriptional regulator